MSNNKWSVNMNIENMDIDPKISCIDVTGISDHFIHTIKVKYQSIINYTYLIVDLYAKESAIIDPAWEFNTMVNRIKDLKSKLTTILLTHSHFDHVNMVQPLVERYGAQVYMCKKEIDFYNYRCRNLNAINQNDIIQLGQTTISCLYTPGHTVGSNCFLLDDGLFTGDTIFIEGCGICHARGGSPEAMYDSIQRIKAMVPEHAGIYPGHSFGKEPGVPLRDVAKNNIYFLFQKKKSFIDFRMRKGQRGIFDFQ